MTHIMFCILNSPINNCTGKYIHRRHPGLDSHPYNFPQGCKWRAVSTEGVEDVAYQYFDFAHKVWSDERPVTCLPVLHPSPGPEDWNWHQGSPRTEVGAISSECV